MDVNYFDTLIAVADDCPVEASRAPQPKGDKKTVALLQYEMLTDSPFMHTSEDVLFSSWLERQPPAERSEADVAQLRADFFAKDQACLRASPLPKQYGWGFLFDSQGRVALLPMESAEYQDVVNGNQLKVLKAMRSARVR